MTARLRPDGIGPTIDAPNIGFRPDVEGLRGLAVLLVVAFHVGLGAASGGFVGVDVFFVLSGYLITALLLREVETTGRIALWAFYARRFRRLLPASAVVLCVVLSLAALVYPPVRVAGVAESARAVAGFTSNLFFSARATDYFRDGLETNPLLHTWSLAVEEQFYVVWPALVLLVARPRMSRRWLPYTLAALIAASLATSWWVTIADRPTAYYGTVMRTWEFAAGAVIALPAVARLVRRTGRTMDVGGAAGGWIGVVLIVGSAVAFSSRTPFPGVHAAIPVVGTALVLLAGTRRALVGSASWLLAWSPMQWLGRHSYGWYLWHWPLLILAAEVLPRAEGASQTAVRAGIVLVALVAAMLTRVLVEEPCRRTRVLRDRPRATVALGIATVVVLVGTATALQRAATRASEEPAQRAFATAKRDTPRLYRDGCAPDTRESNASICTYGSPAGRDTVLLFGDSHAAQWAPALDVVARERHWTLLVLTKSACPSADLPIFEVVLQRRFVECEAWRRAAFDSIRARHPALVVTANSSEYVLDGPRREPRASVRASEWEAGLARTLRVLRRAGVVALVLQDTPEAPHNVPLCLATARWRAQNPGRCDFAVAGSVHGLAAAATQRAVVQVAGSRVVSVVDAVCPKGTCPALVRDTIRFRDSRHLTASASRQLAPVLGQLLPTTVR